MYYENPQTPEETRNNVFEECKNIIDTRAINKPYKFSGIWAEWRTMMYLICYFVMFKSSTGQKGDIPSSSNSDSFKVLGNKISDYYAAVSDITDRFKEGSITEEELKLQIVDVHNEHQLLEAQNIDTDIPKLEENQQIKDTVAA